MLSDLRAFVACASTKITLRPSETRKEEDGEREERSRSFYMENYENLRSSEADEGKA